MIHGTEMIFNIASIVTAACCHFRAMCLVRSTISVIMDENAG